MANIALERRWTSEHGRRLREKRLEKRLSQKETAALLNVSDDTLRNWENGVTKPRDESLAALAEFCGVPVSELLGESPPAEASLSVPVLGDESRTAPPPRFRSRRRARVIAVALGIVLLAGFSIWEVRRWRFTHAFNMVRPLPNGIEAISRSGMVLWRAEGVDPKIAERSVTVRMPDGKTLLACVFAKPSDYRPETVSVLSLLDPEARSPRVVRRIRLPTPGGRLFPDYSRRYDLAYLTALDLDGDGVDEIIATFQQVPECVSYTILYEPTIERARIVFAQTGAHHFTGAWDIDGDGHRDLVFLGINNGYDWMNALAAIRIDPWIGAREGENHYPVRSPDSVGYLPDEAANIFYALLPRGRVPDDPAAVSWDRNDRRLMVKLSSGRLVNVTRNGFLVPSHAGSEKARAAKRLEAFAHDRESRRLGNAGFWNDAIAEGRQAASAAEEAGDPIALEAMQRDLMKALIRAGKKDKGEELLSELVSRSENASEILYDAAIAFHLAGDLRRAVQYYEAGIHRGGSPEAGKSKHEFLLGEVLALVELRDYAETERAIERVRSRYVTNHDWTIPYREFVRWQRGEVPHTIDAPANSTDLLRYWNVEFREARGEDATRLLHDVEELLANGVRPRGALLSLRVALMAHLGRRAEAARLAPLADAEAVKEAEMTIVGRGHLRVVTDRRSSFSP